MGFRHLIREEINYFGFKRKYIDVDGVRYYDRDIEGCEELDDDFDAVAVGCASLVVSR